MLVVIHDESESSEQTMTLKFRWTAGHAGIKGNEEVDIKAKKAAEGKTSNKKDLPLLLCKQLKHNKSALKQQKSSQLKTRWLHKWKASPRYNKINTLDPSFPSNKFIKLISDDRLSRMDASHICQLRMGHIPLNAYLE
jgi:hypothetical protein